MDEVAEDEVEVEPAAVRAGRTRPRRSVKRWWLLGNETTHRWLSLVLGLLLLVVTTSGAILVYKPEITHWTNAAAFAETRSGSPVTLPQAVGIVAAQRPAFKPASVSEDGGVFAVGNTDGTELVTVDPGSGRILGTVRESDFLRFLDNLHECALSCEGYPGYLAWLNDAMPGLGVPGLSAVTVGSFLLGVLGLVLLYLGVTGLILWWPGVKRFAQGFTVRLRRGGYRRDQDLHRVIGFFMLPFLVMWGLSGAGFEFPFVSDAFYALPAQERAPTVTVESTPGTGADVTVQQVEASALAVTGGGRVVGYTLPGDDPKSTYLVYVAKGVNRWKYYEGVPATLLVGVDRHDAGHAGIVYGFVKNNPTDWFFGNIGWGEALHFGTPFNPWLRFPLFLAGLSPLLLAVTGLSTWLFRRRRRRPRRTPGPASRTAASSTVS